MACFTERTSTPFNFIGTKRAVNVNISELGDDIGFCSLAAVAPTNLIADAVTSCDIDVYWTAPTETPLNIQLQVSDDGSVWSDLATLSGSATTFIHGNVGTTTTKFYRVRSLGIIPSEFSNVDSATTGADQPILTTTPLSTTSIQLDWVYTSFDSDTIIQTSTNGGGFITIPVTITSGTNTYNVLGLSVDNTYDFRIQKTDWTCYSAIENTTLTVASGSVACYSMRKLLEVPNNIWGTVRRSIDDATTDILLGSIGNYISINSPVSAVEGTLSAWITAGGGSEDAFVTSWNAQELDGLSQFNAIQTLTSLQPQLISGGVMIEKNGKPAIDFLSGTTKLVAAPIPALNQLATFTALTVSSSNSANNASNQGIIFTIGDDNSNAFSMFRISDNGDRQHANWTNIGKPGNFVFSIMSQFRNNTDQVMGTALSNGTTFDLSTWDNGAAGTLNADFSLITDVVNDRFSIGGPRIGGGYIDGKIQEIIIHPVDLGANRSVLEASIISDYSVPLP